MDRHAGTLEGFSDSGKSFRGRLDQENTSLPGDRRRYRGIIVAIALFVLLDASILVFNFYSSSRLASDAVSVHLAGQLRMLSQRLVVSLYELDPKFRFGDSTESLEALRQSYQLIEETLAGFSRGGELLTPTGTTTEVEAIEDPDSLSALRQLVIAWEPFRNLLSPIINVPEVSHDAYFRGALVEATAYARANNSTMLKLSEAFSSALEKRASERAFRMRMIQGIGLALAIMNFVIILVHFIGQLRRSDRALDQSRRETREILSTVNEGLLLLDEDLEVGPVFSDYSRRLFGTDSLAGRSFLDLFADKLNQQDLMLAKKYLSLLVSGNVNDALTDELNPLQDVLLSIPAEHGGIVRKWMSFQFTRVLHDNEFSHLLVTARDVTSIHQLQDEIHNLKSSASYSGEKLLALLALPASRVARFLSSARMRLNQINQVLKKPARHMQAFQLQREGVLAEVHKLKGEVGVLGFEDLQQALHEMEESLMNLKSRDALQGDDFLPVTVQLNALIRTVDDYRRIFDSLNKHKNLESSDVGQGVVSGQLVLDSKLLKQAARKVAASEQKNVQLQCRQAPMMLSEEYDQAIHDIVNQLLTNSICHGIESPDVRRREGKPETGIVRIVLEKNAEAIVLTVQDDGHGLDANQIRQQALATGRWSAEDIDKLERQQLYALVFEFELSTASSVSPRAGRGVGLAAVRDLVARLNGEIQLASQPGKGTRFRIRLPAVAVNRETPVGFVTAGKSAEFAA